MAAVVSAGAGKVVFCQMAPDYFPQSWQRSKALRVWAKCRWDMLEPSEEPASDAAPTVDVHMMNGEHRAGVFNLTSAAREHGAVRVRVTGLPGSDNPAYVTVHEVLHVGTRHFVAVAAALPEAKRDGQDYVVTVPAGMTRQVWLSFHPRDLELLIQLHAISSAQVEVDMTVADAGHAALQLADPRLLLHLPCQVISQADRLNSLRLGDISADLSDFITPQNAHSAGLKVENGELARFLLD